MRQSSDRSTSSAFSRRAHFSFRGGCGVACGRSGESEMSPRPLLAMERAAALCCGCAAIVTMGGCAMMMNIRPAADSYTYDLGIAAPSEARAKAEAALTPLGYRLSGEDGAPGVRIESQWQSRLPVDDQERASGYEIISRVKLAGRPASAAGAQ